ncbi:hypothetical protein NPIL_329441 [Nephila pilipes]|uniref:PH domain-containing protein n=1 Tax=Nephila pilipes TaxID=299642 RepID=A0A8X6TJS0_NEPPI|nr:hypothetical protein NPIL_329441 [Nephila pilipes]
MYEQQMVELRINYENDQKFSLTSPSCQDRRLWADVISIYVETKYTPKNGAIVVKNARRSMSTRSLGVEVKNSVNISHGFHLVYLCI